ncbi:MAG: polysaccharide biosynthesis C-terminal domain-containing protein [Bacteroidetes bacterium]|nr:polysaccharide biosynthesis C-terminal domain-containing protein [Bacteroidota bacterium]
MLRNAVFGTLMARLLAAAAGFGTVVLCSRFMGAEGRGTLSILLALVQVMMIASEFVGGSTLVNLTPRFGVQRLWPGSYLWLGAVLLFSATVMYLSGKQHLWMSLLMALPLGLLTIHYSLLQGLGDMRSRNRAQLIYELLKMLMVAALFLCFQQETGRVQGTVMAFSMAALIAWMLTLPRLRSGIPGSLNMPRALFAAGWWSQLGHLVQFLNYRAALFLIDYWLGNSETGRYSNALVIADAVWIFGNSLGSVAHMRMVLRPDAAYARNLLRRYHSLSVCGTTLAVLFLLFLPDAVYMALFGAEFRGFRTVLLPLLPVILLLSASTLPSHLLHAANDFRHLLLANVSGWVVQFLLSLWLIPRYGLQGAAIAAGFGFLCILLMVWRRLLRKHGIQAGDFIPRINYARRLLRRMF